MRLGKINLENIERDSLITRLLRYRINPPNGLMEIRDVASEASGHLFVAFLHSVIFWLYSS